MIKSRVNVKQNSTNLISQILSNNYMHITTNNETKNRVRTLNKIITLIFVVLKYSLLVLLTHYNK